MIDPSPALRLLLDLPLRVSVDPQICEALGRLDQQGRAPAVAWPAVYQEALGLAERVLADCERRIDEAQKRTLAIEEAAEKLRGQGGPRRQLDQARQDLRQAHSQLRQDWRSRLQRQQEQLQEKLQEALGTLVLEVTSKPSGAEVRAQESWLAQIGAYADKLLREWRAQLAESVPASISAKVSSVAAALQELSVGVPPVPQPPSLSEPEAWKLAAAAQPFEVPAFGAALMQYVRGHLMTASMLGTMLFGALAAAVSLSGAQPGSTGMYARGWLLLLALPPSLVFGIVAARRSRKVALEKGRDQKKQAISQALAADVQRALARQTSELDRAVGLSLDAAFAAAEAWLAQAAQPALAKLESSQQEQLRTQKLELRQLQDRAGEARTLKSQLSQSILPELRRRLRDLAQSAAAS